VVGPVDGVPVQHHVLRSVHRHGCLTFPSVPACRVVRLHKLTCLTSACLRSRAPGPVSGQLCGTTDGGVGHTVPVSCRLSATGVRFLPILSRRGVQPLLRSAYRRDSTRRTTTGFPCSARVRRGWVWVLSLPRGRRCSRGQHTSLTAACRFSSASPYSSQCNHPTRKVRVTRHQHKLLFTRPAFPSPVTPSRDGDPWAFPRASHPTDREPATHVAVGTGLEHRPGATSSTSVEPPSSYSLIACDLTSQCAAHRP
jgi:hypothetical protein